MPLPAQALQVLGYQLFSLSYFQEVAWLINWDSRDLLLAANYFSTC